MWCNALVHNRNNRSLTPIHDPNSCGVDIEGVDKFKIIQHTVDEIEVLIKTHPDLFPENGQDRNDFSPF
ncbi:MAG: hypothetical protein U9P10_09295 [Thermodesulfobacteriota bacterium]|nr:hypothetical protein [Thermodesulfobacteriota bacterium]